MFVDTFPFLFFLITPPYLFRFLALCSTPVVFDVRRPAWPRVICFPRRRDVFDKREQIPTDFQFSITPRRLRDTGRRRAIGNPSDLRPQVHCFGDSPPPTIVESEQQSPDKLAGFQLKLYIKLKYHLSPADFVFVIMRYWAWLGRGAQNGSLFINCVAV